MSKYQGRHRNTKVTETHHTFLPFAQQIREWAEKEPTVTKIVAGHVRYAGSSANTIKIKYQTGCINIIAKGPKSLQEIRFYVSDAVAFVENLCYYADQQNIRVIHECVQSCP